MRKIIILTGSELRHDFVRKFIADSSEIDVIASYCEGSEKSLKSLVENENEPISFNVEARDINTDDLLSRPQSLPRFDCNQFPFGAIN